VRGKQRLLAAVRLFFFGACASLLTGCEPTQLYLAYRTNVGINASVNPEMTEGSLIIGYRRNFATIVPKSVPLATDPTGRDAMSALVCSDLVVTGIFLHSYVESLATGKASQTFAAHLNDALGQPDDFFSCYKKTAAQEQDQTGGSK
jgi:hypothetical protein